MRELSLFSGAGGGLLGSKLLGWRTLGYVENNPYCQKVLRQRIADGILDPAPIFGDIRKFISEGWAELYNGKVDIVTAGFPCQPFSVVGEQRGGQDALNMWPSCIESIRHVRPRYALLENVPGLLVLDYFGEILGDLAESGYDALWTSFCASDIGADHIRERLWIFAYPQGESREKTIETILTAGRKGKAWPSPMREFGRKISRSHWTVYPPRVVRGLHGLAGRVDRSKAIGNGQVPIVVKTAWQTLTAGGRGSL